jgi:hypothetical protein
MIVLQISIYRPDGKLAAMMIQTSDGTPKRIGDAYSPGIRQDANEERLARKTF